jgi:hypothetical protein
MKCQLIIALSLTVGLWADASAGLSLYLGSDWTHGMNTPSQKKVLDFEYSKELWNDSPLLWTASTAVFGSSTDQTITGCAGLKLSGERLYGGIGLCLKNNSHDDVVTGKFTYRTQIGWTFYKPSKGHVAAALELEHFSNCSSILIKVFDDYCFMPGLPRGKKPNIGYNFMGVRVKW